MGVPMRALVRQVYDGRGLMSGDPFEVASEGEALDLIAMRYAERRIDGDEPPATTATPAKGQYDRRDMRARR